MNWLAHAFLSPRIERVCLGNLLADAIEGGRVASLHDEIRRGVALHRAIDAAVHIHPAAMQARRALTNTRLRFSGVVTDVVWDHFLLKHWAEFSGEPAESFIARVYGFESVLPAELSGGPAQLMRAIVTNDYLHSYATLDGVREVLWRLSRRIEMRHGRSLPLAEAVDDVQANYALLDECFVRLFPDLIALVREKEGRVAAQDFFFFAP